MSLHPTITFQVNLELNAKETIGPLTNAKEVAVAHPDTFQNSPDRGRTEKAVRKSNRSLLQLGFYPYNFHHGDTFTLSGQQALDVREKFVSGAWNNYAPTGGLGGVLEII